MRSIRRLTYFSASVALVLGATACADSSTAVYTATVRFNITWPTAQAQRLVPERTQSIRIALPQLAFIGTLTTAVVAERPTTQVVLTNVLLGDTTVTATAYPEAAAGGTPVAAGTLPITVARGDQQYGDIVMGSTIASIEVTPQPASVAIGSATGLTATARDSLGRAVLVAPTNPFSWSIPSGATLVSRDSSTGGTTQVTGVAVGQATVQATERESGVSGTTTVTVAANSGDVGVVVQ